MTTTPDHTKQNDTELAERVLGRIEREHVRPRPRWEFTLKNGTFWSLGALAVILGALAFALSLFKLTAIDWRLSPLTHTSFLSFFFEAVPFLWIGALVLFIFIGYRNIRLTKRGYRYSLTVITLGAVLTSLTLGSGLYAIGLGHMLDTAMGNHPPFFRSVDSAEHAWWLEPGQGFLTGTVTVFSPHAASFILRDSSGQFWAIDGSELRTPDRAVVVRGGVVRVVGVPVQVPMPQPRTAAGTATTSLPFHACFVFPWVVVDATTSVPNMVPATAIPLSATTTRNGACDTIRTYARFRTLDTDSSSKPSS